MKKWLTIVLAVLMTVALFGCSTTSTETTDTPATPVVTPPAVAPDATGTEEETTDETTEEAPAASKWDTEVTVDYAGFGDSGVDYNDIENDAIIAHVYEKFKIKWEIIPLDWSNWTENFRIWVNAGDLPTQCFTDFVINDFAGYVEQGLIAQFPEGWEEKYPNIYQTWQLNGISSFVFPNWGGTYAQVHAIYFQTPIYPYSASWAPQIRKDWVEKLGGDPNKTVYSWSEFEALCNDVLNNYETLGLTKGTDYVWAQEFGNLSGVFNNAFDFETGIVWDEEAQAYVFGLDREYDFNNFVGKIDAIKRGYQTGWIHPDLFVFTSNREAGDIFDAGNSFIYYEGSFDTAVQGYWTSFREASGLEASDCLQLIIFTDDNGVHHTDEGLNYWACTVWNPNIDADLFDRLLSLGDYRLGDGKYTMTLGIEGEDWEMGDDGYIVDLRDHELYPKLTDKYPASGIFQSYFICSDDVGSYTPAVEKAVREVVAQTWSDKQVYSNDKGACDRYDYYYNMYSSDMKSKFVMDWDALMGEIISTGADTAPAVQAFIDQNRTLIDEVLADVNANVTPQRVAAN